MLATEHTVGSDQAARPGWAAWLDRILICFLTVTCLTSTFWISVTEIALGASLLALLMGLALRPRPRCCDLRSGLELPILAMFVWAVAMVPLSGEPAQSLIYLRRFYLFAALWLGLLAAGGGWSGWPPVRIQRALLTALLVGGAGTAAYGLIRYLSHEGVFIDSTDGFIKGRLESLQGYMTAAGLLMMTGLTALAFLLNAGTRRSRWQLVAALLPLLAALALTMTRSAWLGFGAGAVVLISLTHRRWLPVLALLLVAGFLLAPDVARDRIRSITDPRHVHNAQRVQMWRIGWQIVRDHPLTGVGDRDLNELYWTYREREAGRPISRATYPGGPLWVAGHLHNNIVQVAVIWGVPGLVLVAGFLLLALIKLARLWRRLAGLGAADPPRPEQAHWARGWVLAAVAAWTAFMTAGLFEWYLGDAEVALLMWLLIGLALGSGRRALASGQADAPISAPE